MRFCVLNVDIVSERKRLTLLKVVLLGSESVLGFKVVLGVVKLRGKVFKGSP